MLKNYIKIAWRNLAKHKSYSFINISGLAIGITACLLIIKYVSYETSYDDFHAKSNQLFRVTVDLFKEGELTTQSARVAPAVASSFTAEIPEIENFTRMIILGDDGVVSYGDKAVGESNMYLTDNSFFELFSFPLISGNAAASLSEPFTIVLSQQVSEALFDDNPIGKIVTVNADNFDGQSVQFEVTGVMKEIPANSHIQPNVLISYPTLYQFVGHRFDNSWNWNETYTYFQLHEEAFPEQVEAKFPPIFERQNKQMTDEQNVNWQYNLQAVSDIHLHSDLQYEAGVNGNATYIYFLLIVSLLVLFVAYINYINLTTVQSFKRMAEVGVRKVSGAHRGQLITQFMAESVIKNFLAVSLALVLYELLSPLLTTQFGLPGDPGMGLNIFYLFALGLLVLVLTIGGSLYPAFIVSRYQPAEVLKGSHSKSLPGCSLRKILVATQFAAFVVLIAITAIVYRQVEYMKNQDPGFTSDQIVIVKAPKSVHNLEQISFTQFRDQISSFADIMSVSGSATVPGEEIYQYSDQININQKQIAGVFSLLPVEPGFFDQYNIELLEGEPLRNNGRDEIIINEEALQVLGFDQPSEVIGQVLMNNGHKSEIKGVVKNYHHENLKLAIEPIIFFGTDAPNYYSIEINSANAGATLSLIQTQFEELFPGSPYQYFFLNDFYNQKYNAEEQFNILFGIFTALATIVAFIGLFGLTSYSAELRTKEIGIRKVLGANIANIVALLSKDFIKLVIIGFVIAIPIAWYAMNQWLANFAYRIEIGPGIFALAGGAALLIALLTVSWQSVKAALMNPVESLKNE